MDKKRVGFSSSLGGLFILTGLLLTACGADVSTVGLSTTTTPAATTAAATPAATTAAATPVATTAAAAPPANTAAVATAPATTVAPATPTPEVVPTATPLPAVTTAPAPTTSAPVSSAFIFYLKDGSLWTAKADGSDKQKLADNVYANTVKVSANQAVFYQIVKSGGTSILQVKVIRLDNGGKVEGIVDNRANETLADQGGILEYQGRAELAISPDGSQVVYTKVNNSAPVFEGLRGNQHPTELWLANLDPKNPAPKRLAPNDKDFMARPTWSTDGNRIAFVRTNNFGTGAGYPTELWSVFKDGSRLSYLTGPDVAKIGSRKIQAFPAFNFKWVGPLALTYQASNQITASIMLHDLSQNNDTSRVLAADADYNAFYCPQVRRYVFTRIDPEVFKQVPGVYSVDVDKPGTPDAAPLDEKGTAIFGCQNDTVLYRDAAGQFYAQHINADGSPNGAKVKLGFANGDKNFTRAAMSPGGRYIALGVEDNAKKTSTVSLYRSDGVNILVAGGNLSFSLTTMSWAGEQTLTLEGTASANQTNILAVVNLAASNPSVKQLDSSTGFVLLAGMDR